jgi:hypothetical protein
MAMKMAEKVLGIPHIIDADDLIAEGCDEKVVLAYLGFFKDKVTSQFSYLVLI